MDFCGQMCVNSLGKDKCKRNLLPYFCLIFRPDLGDKGANMNALKFVNL